MNCGRTFADRYVREYFDYPLRALQVNQQHRDEIPETFKLDILLDDVSAVHLQESPLSKDQKHEQQADGRMRITATVANTERLRWWLLSYGDRIEVIGPATLRKELAGMAERMHQRYFDSSTVDRQSNT